MDTWDSFVRVFLALGVSILIVKVSSAEIIINDMRSACAPDLKIERVTP